MQMKRTTLAIAGLLFALAGCGRENAATAPPGVIELSDQFSSEFVLVDQNGAPSRDEDFRGKVMVVYFGYTNCPDVCPIDVAVLSAALNELGDSASEVAPLFISVDPERDTPEALKAYLSFDPRLTGLTGSVEAAKAARDSFKLYARKQEQADSALGYTVDHGRFFYVVDRDGRPVYAITGGADPQELAVMLRRSIKS
ncbi:MAG: SCO family protein [Parvularculaceae bacterium]